MEINQPAPGFELPDLEGRLWRLSDLRGRMVIVNFWSAECLASERVDIALLDLLASWGDKVILLTIAANVGETESTIAQAARSHSLPVVLQGNPQVVDDFQASTTPHLFVIDGEGILRYRGSFDDLTFRSRTVTRRYLQEAVDALLAGGLPATPQTDPYGCAIIRFVLE